MASMITCGGISRGIGLVRHGLSKSLVVFLAIMPPRTVSGKPTRIYTSIRSRIVVKGKACVDPAYQ